MVRCGSKNKYSKDMCLKRDWTIFSVFINYSRCTILHNWGGPTRAFDNLENFYFDNNQDAHMSSEIMGKLGKIMIWSF